MADRETVSTSIPDTIVHLLDKGRALCGKPGRPGDWGIGHRWVRTDSDEAGPRWKANCAGCVMAARLASPDTSLPFFLGAARMALVEPDTGSPERRRETAEMIDALMPYLAALVQLGRRHPDELAALMPKRGEQNG